MRRHGPLTRINPTPFNDGLLTRRHLPHDVDAFTPGPSSAPERGNAGRTTHGNQDEPHHPQRPVPRTVEA